MIRKNYSMQNIKKDRRSYVLFYFYKRVNSSLVNRDLCSFEFDFIAGPSRKERLLTISRRDCRLVSSDTYCLRR